MLLAMVLWGIGWPALKVVTHSDVPVIVVTFWRFFIMLLAFIPILFVYKKALRISKEAVGIVFVSALLNIAFMLVSYWGVGAATAGAGGVIITTISPILTLLLALRFLHVSITKRQIIGIGVGLLGGMIMLQIWRVNVLEAGNLFFVLSAFIWALLTLLSQKSHQYLSPIHYSFLLSVIATLLMFVAALPYNLGVVFEQDASFWWGILFLGVMGQSVASTIYFVASGRIGSQRASSYMFVVPVTALVASYVMLHEMPSLWLLAGGIVASAAVYIINKPEKVHHHS